MNPANEFPFADASELVRRATNTNGSITGSSMVGGASTRRFARFELESGRSIVAIYVPDANRSDEIVKKPSEPVRRWPFLEVRDLLAQHGVRVPAIIGEATDRGLLLVEDLGDLTLAVALERFPHQKTRFYQRAVADLAHAQRALSRLPHDCVVCTRMFDEQLLRWEIDHFREWALDARGIHLDEVQGRVFDAAADSLSRSIASWPRGFVHRDYQSRNLMVRFDDAGDFEITWIDFQDALLGPRVYDLVALLGDSYQTFEPDFIDARLDEYASVMGLDALARRRLRQEFDMVTVQRKLKDAGRFVFIDRVKQNPSFLGFVEPTIEKVMAALGRLQEDPNLAALARVLTQVLHF